MHRRRPTAVLWSRTRKLGFGDGNGAHTESIFVIRLLLFKRYRRRGPHRRQRNVHERRVRPRQRLPRHPRGRRLCLVPGRAQTIRERPHRGGLITHLHLHKSGRSKEGHGSNERHCRHKVVLHGDHQRQERNPTVDIAGTVRPWQREEPDAEYRQRMCHRQHNHCLQQRRATAPRLHLHDLRPAAAGAIAHDNRVRHARICLRNNQSGPPCRRQRRHDNHHPHESEAPRPGTALSCLPRAARLDDGEDSSRR